MKQVGVAVSIGFPLMVMGVLALMILLVSWVGATTALWIICAAVLAIGIISAASRRVI